MEFGLEPVERGGAFSVDEKLEKTLHFSVFGVADVFGEVFAVLLCQFFQHRVDCDFFVFGELQVFFFFACCFS